MSLDAMKQVTEAEQAARAQRAEAEAQAKRLVAEAELLRQAEAQAARNAEEVMAEARRACDALRERAEGRLPQAADSIVRRVVKTDVHR